MVAVGNKDGNAMRLKPFAGIAQGFSLAPANEWLQLAALVVLFFIFAGLRTVRAGFLAGLFFGIGWFASSLA